MYAGNGSTKERIAPISVIEESVAGDWYYWGDSEWDHGQSIYVRLSSDSKEFQKKLKEPQPIKIFSNKK